MRLGKVILDLNYVVDLDNSFMVEEAIDCIYEDIMNAVKYNELGEWITTIEDPNATEADIPEFLLDNEEE